MRLFTRLEEVLGLLSEDNPFQNRPWVLGEGVDDPDVLLVKATPAFAELKHRKPFLGDDGKVIRQMVFELGLRPYFTTVVPFIPDGKLKIRDGKVFSPHITETIRKLGVRHVLLFGADAVKLVDEFDYPFSRADELYDRTFERDGITFGVFPHPSLIGRTPSMYNSVKAAMNRVVRPESFEGADDSDETSYEVHYTRESAEEALKGLGALAACDVESTGLDVYTDRILTIQLSWEEGTGHSFKWELFSPEEWQEILQRTKLVFQNGSYDVKILANHGVNVSISEDTMLMHSLIDETPGTHSMDAMANRYLGIEKWADMVNYESMEDNDSETLGRYGARDVDLTLRLANIFRPQVVDRPIFNVLHSAQNAINKAELRGIKVDREKAFRFQEEIEKALHDRKLFMEDVYGLANPNSPQQVAKLLYEDMGLPVQKKAGRVTTDEDALERLASMAEVPAVKDILEYRNLTKANGTYLKNILSLTERDGRYHPDFRLAATETGRLAESLILLIPRPTGAADANLGKQYQQRLRELFIPDEGHLMIGADYSGFEISTAAHITNDSRLINDVRGRVDIHSVVAVQAFNLQVPEDVENLKGYVGEHYAHERNLAKAGVFAWLFGGDENTIARNLNIPLETATNIIDALKSIYHGVASWQELIHAQIVETGYVQTPWGRRRHFNFNPSFSRKVVLEQMRESTNMPIQGMASDMTLASFTKLTDMGIQTLFPFHDAVYVQAPEDEAEEVAATVKEVMEGILPSPVPFRADVGIGENWGVLG